MNCYRCVIEGPQFGPKPAITVYKGTALCAKHAMQAELDERREESSRALMPAGPKRAK